MKILCVCPIFDRLNIAGASVASLADQGFQVVGITDGLEIPLASTHPNYRQEQHAHRFFVENMIRRLFLIHDSDASHILLFDSDMIFLPSAKQALENLATKIGDGDDCIGSIYNSPVFRSLESMDAVYEKAFGVGGATMLMSRATAVETLKRTPDFFDRSSRGDYAWDNALSAMYRAEPFKGCIRTKMSHAQHLGEFTGTNGAARLRYGMKETAKNIDDTELKKTMVRYGL